MSERSEAGRRAYFKKLEARKYKLGELSGEHRQEAFQRVRLIKANTVTDWLSAYDTVIHELEQAKKESK